VAWSRWSDTRRRKGESTGNTNFDLNRRASPRPYHEDADNFISSFGDQAYYKARDRAQRDKATPASQPLDAGQARNCQAAGDRYRA
jgi:hypothetical protein